MASIFITYGMLGFPFLFGLISESSANEKTTSTGEKIKKHTYWQWVLVGFTIVLGLFILRYVRVAIKWKEAKQYILNKMGRGIDTGNVDQLESKFDYYWKSTLFFPGWFFNYFLFPQSSYNLFISYFFLSFFLGYTSYYASIWFRDSSTITSISGKSYQSRGSVADGLIAGSIVAGCLFLSVVTGALTK